MKIKEFNVVLAGLSVAALTLQSCGTYDDGPALSLKSKAGRLTGEWELKDAPRGFLDDGFDVIFEFQKDGDFKMTTTYDYGSYSYSYSYKGDWDWSDGKTALDLEIDGETNEWDILRLTNTELVLEYYGGEWEFEKQ